VKRHLILCCLAAASAAAIGAETTVKLTAVDAHGLGAPLGSVRLLDTPHGLVLYPALKGLQPGLHGFHVHQNAECGHGMKEGKPLAGLAAGGHYDPGNTGKHEGPYGKGHLGDLPALYAGPDGKATLPVLAPRLKVSDIRDRSLMVHSGGDNYSDLPEKLGGGGSRAACGVVK